jgi:hypothetical protein
MIYIAIEIIWLVRDLPNSLLHCHTFAIRESAVHSSMSILLHSFMCSNVLVPKIFICLNEVKGQVKLTLESAMKAQTENINIVLFFL